MKKIMLGILLLGGLITAHETEAQINVNVGLQPAWGPVGYQHVDYYYLPDIESYYYVPRKQFIHLNNGKWVYSAGLPSAYRNYNLYNGYKVVVNEPRPYLRHATYKVKYAKYKGVNGKQASLKNNKSNAPKYSPAKKTGVVNKSKPGAPAKGKGKGKGKS